MVSPKTMVGRKKITSRKHPGMTAGPHDLGPDAMGEAQWHLVSNPRRVLQGMGHHTRLCSLGETRWYQKTMNYS